MKIEVTGNHPNAILSLQSECDADLAYLSQIQSQLTTAKSDYLRMNRGDGSSRIGVRLEPTPEAKAGIEERLSNMTIDQALRYLPADAMARSQLENLRRMLAEAQEKARRPSPVVRSTHTFAKLAVSHATFMEIAGKLRQAEYDHAFIDDVIDMHGIGLVENEAAEPPKPMRDTQGSYIPTQSPVPPPEPPRDPVLVAEGIGSEEPMLLTLTPGQKKFAHAQIIMLLDQALAADPVAMDKMIKKKFPCNRAFADHPTIQCGDVDGKDGEFEVGMLGLINGIVEPVTGLRVMAIYHDGKLNHFEQWKDPGFPT